MLEGVETYLMSHVFYDDLSNYPLLYNNNEAKAILKFWNNIDLKNNRALLVFWFCQSAILCYSDSRSASS